ncbi:DUF2785 domain-containing protein [Liquorilactobacillus hordei]|uniref:DUF2785 domain-containing protein n=1 Tax=Liquorilactobacillus hordei TaxID=468911 RepID=UPI00070B5B2B|nr:DUF2785 domain-containing protein [Liquorilactobacillus hordei]QYH51805.1 DUF2785 domain-containing protein [Liquorilactobacillus hordei DSM 19519]
MKKELRKLIDLPEGNLSFKDKTVMYMMNNLGNVDPELRDTLIYSLFARGFEEKSFTTKQQQMIITGFINNLGLFTEIGRKKDDRVFLRSFSALLGSILLDADGETPLFTDKQRELIFKSAIDNLKKESDFRGYVPEKGWAHAIAHGSDFLGYSISHKNFHTADINSIFDVMRCIMNKLTVPFIDEEEQRIAYAFFQGVSSKNIKEQDLVSFIQKYDNEVWEKYSESKDELSAFYRLSTWFHIMQNWYFMFFEYQDIKEILYLRIKKYLEKMFN